MENQNIKTATERLEELEKTQMNLLQALQSVELMSRDLMFLKEAAKLLDNKLNSVIKASVEGKALTQENINSYMVENNVAELKQKVEDMVNQGMLAENEYVKEDSFLVVSESDSEGKVTNPRLQFLLSTIQSDEIKSKLVGVRVGDSIAVDDKGNTVLVLESYNVVTPKAPVEAASAEVGASDSAASEPLEESLKANNSDSSAEAS